MVPLRLTMRCVVAAIILVAGSLTVGAQTSSQRASNAKELDPADPRAQRASALAKLLLAPTPQEAVRYLQTHAAEGSPAASATETQIRELHATIGSRFVVDRLIEGAEDEVVVLLNNATSERGGRMGLRITIERAAPHRIREVRMLQSQQRREADLRSSSAKRCGVAFAICSPYEEQNRQ